MPLTNKQQRFVEEYCVDFNGTQAAIRAGFAKPRAKEQAYQLLCRDEIAAAVQDRMTELASAAGVTTERVIRELALLGFSNMADYMSPSVPDANPLLDLRDITRDQAAAISEYTVETIAGGVLKTKIKLADKRSVLELLGKHLGIFKDGAINVNVEGNQVQVYLPDNGRD